MKISDGALAKLKSLCEEGKALRVAIAGGGCSGLQYKMSWVSVGETTLQDKVSDHDGLSVVIDPKSGLYLASVELDYSNDLNDSGFKWTNQAATATCGCGSSFR